MPLAVVNRGDPTRYRVAVLCDEGESDYAAFEMHVQRPLALRARGWRVVRVHAREWARARDAVVKRVLDAAAE